MTDEKRANEGTTADAEQHRYRIREGSGACEYIRAESLEAAMEEAREWASEGDYTERVMVSYHVGEVDDDGEEVGGEIGGEVEAGPMPEAPGECGVDEDDHDWRNPEWLGGCSENPGVWSLGGTTIVSTAVCSRCGTYRTVTDSGNQRNPGGLEREVTYNEADDQSEAWVESLREA